MQNDKIMAVILEYDYFLKLSEEKRQKLLAQERVECRVYIPKEKSELLTTEKKERLEGFVITHIKPIEVKEYSAEDLFPKEIPEILPTIEDNKKIEQTFKKKHYQKSRPPAPRKIYNRNFNTHKKGGR